TSKYLAQSLKHPNIISSPFGNVALTFLALVALPPFLLLKIFLYSSLCVLPFIPLGCGCVTPQIVFPLYIGLFLLSDINSLCLFLFSNVCILPSIALMSTFYTTPPLPPVDKLYPIFLLVESNEFII